MSEVTTYTPIQVFQSDPTRTLTLRNAFVADVNRRFRDLTRVITEAVVEQDCFGLGVNVLTETTPPGYRQFAFGTSQDKVEAFMKWLLEQEEKGLLEIKRMPRLSGSSEAPWTDMYIWDSYKRGVQRARYELKKAGYDVPTVEASGGAEAMMSAHFHAERVAIMFTRTFSELKNITAAMDNQISKVLSQGIVDGDGMRYLARKLVATINGSGIGELGITDTLGRYIPAQRRAMMLARTEVVRAHHIANIMEYRTWQAFGVQVIAEWSTAGDERVCSRCSSLHGNRFTLNEIEHMIPVHPSCRCIAIPIASTPDKSKIS